MIPLPQTAEIRLQSDVLRSEMSFLFQRSCAVFLVAGVLRLGFIDRPSHPSLPANPPSEVTRLDQ